MLCSLLCQTHAQASYVRDKNWPVALVSEDTGFSHTCTAKTNYNPVKHLIKCHLCSVCFIRNMSSLREMSSFFFCLNRHLLQITDSCAVVLALFDWLCFTLNFSFRVYSSGKHWFISSPFFPQAPPLKLTAITVPSIATTQASLWSLSMMVSAPTWWFTPSLFLYSLHKFILSVKKLKLQRYRMHFIIFTLIKSFIIHNALCTQVLV